MSNARPVMISINSAWNIVNFRAGLITALQEAGYEVLCVAPDDGPSDEIRGLGARFIAIDMDNKGTSPRRDSVLTMRYRKLMKRERPLAFLGYTVKPNVYGSLAAQSLGIPVINNVSGLGTAFIQQNWLTRVVKRLYRMAFSRSHTVFFQNADDRGLFVEHGLVRREKTEVLPGSGVDLAKFRPVTRPAPEARAPTVFLLVARLVYDKGIREYVEAAREVRRTHPNAVFRILGFLDVANRTAVSREAVEAWVAEGIMDYLGSTDDVRPYLAAADCVVLPSYREGTPRTLLEAAAMARPLIATDVPGCREPVVDGVNGYLCTVRDGASLAKSMRAFLSLTAEEKSVMGAESRTIAEGRYDERLVIAAYLRALNSAISG